MTTAREIRHVSPVASALATPVAFYREMFAEPRPRPAASAPRLALG